MLKNKNFLYFILRFDSKDTIYFIIFLFMKSSENYTYFLPAFYLSICLMKASKNFEKLFVACNSISLTPLTCNRTCYNHLYIDEVRFQPNNNSHIKHKHYLRNISSQQFIDSITSTNNLNMKVRIEII